jgi:hypothetical protein
LLLQFSDRFLYRFESSRHKFDLFQIKFLQILFATKKAKTDVSFSVEGIKEAEVAKRTTSKTNTTDNEGFVI